MPLKKIFIELEYSRFIIGRKAKISENPIKEIRIAEDEARTD
jgi:hypothetical protein